MVTYRKLFFPGFSKLKEKNKPISYKFCVDYFWETRFTYIVHRNSPTFTPVHEIISAQDKRKTQGLNGTGLKRV